MEQSNAQQKVKKVIRVSWIIYCLLGLIGLIVFLCAVLLQVNIPVETQRILSKLIPLYTVGAMIFGWVITLVNDKNHMALSEKIIISLWLGGGVILMLLSIAEVPKILGFLVWYGGFSFLFSMMYFFWKQM